VPERLHLGFAASGPRHHEVTQQIGVLGHAVGVAGVRRAWEPRRAGVALTRRPALRRARMASPLRGSGQIV